jgi:hypothetical protein
MFRSYVVSKAFQSASDRILELRRQRAENYCIHACGEVRVCCDQAVYRFRSSVDALSGRPCSRLVILVQKAALTTVNSPRLIRTV